MNSSVSMRSRTALVLLALTAACGRGEITYTDAQTIGTLTVNASTAWAYVDLATGTTVTPATPATSTTWDIGFNATNVALNGGTSGPVGVAAYCICQNANATNDQILAMTPDNQADAFVNLTPASIPATTTGWSSDLFATAKWYRYSILGDNRISPTFDVFLVRRGAAVYKVQIIGYYGPAGETRRITFRYALLRAG